LEKYQRSEIGFANRCKNSDCMQFIGDILVSYSSPKLQRYMENRPGADGEGCGDVHRFMGDSETLEDGYATHLGIISTRLDLYSFELTKAESDMGLAPRMDQKGNSNIRGIHPERITSRVSERK
jgi:hypothetical protein